MEWDKDDDDALDFATAAANLRASMFGIPLKTRFDVKQMAGNIIPAIATTNAIIAGAIILQGLHVLRQDWKSAKSVWFGRTAQRALNSTILEKPNAACGVCRTTYIPLKVAYDRMTLRTLIYDIAQDWLGVKYEFSVGQGLRLLYDPDFQDNESKTLAELDIGQGSQLQLSDEDGEHMPVIFVLSQLVNETVVAGWLGLTNTIFSGSTAPRKHPSSCLQNVLPLENK